jgi:hypothetical protein
VRPRARAKRDLELVTQEQVLDHEVEALMEEGGQGGEEEAEQVKHPRRVADRAGWGFALLQVVPKACRPYRAKTKGKVCEHHFGAVTGLV